MMIAGPDNCIMSLIRLVYIADDKLASTRGPVIQFDASLWGAGATLKINGVIKEYWVVEWKNKDVAHLGIQTSDPTTPDFLGNLGLSALPDHMEQADGQQKEGATSWRQPRVAAKHA